MKRWLGWVVLIFVSAPLLAGAHPSAHERMDRLSEAIHADPEEPSNYVRRGRVARDEGRFEEARRDFDRAERLGDPILVAFDRALLEHRMGDFAAARRLLDAFLSRFPGHLQALETRARVARDAGDRRAALADFRAFFAQNGKAHPGDYVSAAALLTSDEAEGVEAALALLDEGMARLGVVPQLQRPAIALERSRDRHDLALARLESLAPSLGSSPSWNVELAESLLRLDRIDEAAAAIVAARGRLDRLPGTPARLELRKRIEALDPPPNALSPEEARSGWQLLFDGRSFSGWTDRPGGEEGTSEGWRIREGILEPASTDSFGARLRRWITPARRQGRELVTLGRFDRFELTIDWRASPGRGDDSASPSASAARPAGHWNRSRIRVDGDRIEHRLNGEVVPGSPNLDRVIFDRAAADGRTTRVPGYGLSSDGHILLQDRGDPIGYRNIKLRSLPAHDDERRRASAASTVMPASAGTAP